MTGIHVGAAGSLIFPAAAGGITLVDSGSASETDTVTFNVSLLENDIVVMFAASEDAGGDDIEPGGAITTIAVTTNPRPGFWAGAKRMGATPDTSLTLNDSRIGLAWGVFRGCSTSVILDRTPISDLAQPATNPCNPGSHTTNTDNAMRIVAAGIDGTDLTSFSAPSGYTDGTFGTQGSGAATAFWGYKLAGAAGAEDPGAFTQSANDRGRVIHFALRPA